MRGGKDRERSLSQDSNSGRCSTTALHAGSLHTRLPALTLIIVLNGDSQNYC